MTAEKGKSMKRSAAVVTGTVVALGGSAAPAFADAVAEGAATGSPGGLTGQVVQVPVHIPVNVCGNTVNGVGLLNPAYGNKCTND
ncbi:chaplin [Streptomyces leeuwenhoekii]|jgi:hypothetical protein|uniref:chaplin n=2 Tax=Streptomyces leeuwenhoekii TaxID=1437453 RepID=UPI003694AED3